MSDNVAQMQDFLQVAVSAAENAGRYVLEAAGQIQNLDIQEKKPQDYVSEVDRNSEKLIAEAILAAFPAHSFVGEEMSDGNGEVKSHDNGYQWVVDPLDGTTNFLRSIAHYAISIALFKDNEPIIGVVFDPSKNELFHATKGAGAFLNGQAIGVSKRPDLRGGVFATGIPFGGETLLTLPQFIKNMQQILDQQTAGIRRLGSAALDLAYVACGRYEGYWEANLNCWDIAAGCLLVEEAGGKVSDLRGNNNHFQNGDIVAANPDIHQKMTQLSYKAYNQ